MDAKTEGRREVWHCAHWGAFKVLVEDGRITGVRPFEQDPRPSPQLQATPEWMTSALRIDEPMVRRGWLEGRDRGRRGRREDFVPIPWQQALDLVAGEIDRVRRDHGNASIFAGSYGWASAGRFNHPATLLKRLLNLAGGYTGHVDTYSVAAGAVILNRVLGNDDAYYGRATSLANVARHTQMLLAFGGLPLRTAQIEAGGVGRHMLGEHLAAMAARGVKVVNVSPCRQDLPGPMPVQWLAIRPNTDTALMLGLMHTLVRHGRHDTAFLQRCCVGADRLIDYLMGREDGVQRDADWAAGICELPADVIRRLALDLADHRSMVTASWAMQRSDHGEQPYWAAVALACMLGQVGLPGGGFGMGYASVAGTGVSYPLSLSPGIGTGRKAIDSFIPVARISDMLLNPGAPFDYDGRRHAYPDIRLVYWAGGNPFHHHQDLNRLREAWQRPETVVVQDPFWTATALRADIVLPATTSLERNDLAGNKRSSYIFAMQQAVAPRASARDDYDIFRELARRLGCEAAFSEGRSAMDWLRYLYERTRADARERLGAVNGFGRPGAVDMPPFDAFWQTGYLHVPEIPDHVYLADFRADPRAHPLATPSGKIELYSEQIASLGYADCPGHPAWLEPAEWLGSELREQYPFHLISSQPEHKLHSQLDFGHVSQRGKQAGREQVQIHPDDAAALGLRQGDVVKLSNARGACLAAAALNDALRRGVLVLPTGAWYRPADDDEALELGGNPNVLTLDKGSSRLGQGTVAHTCLVALEKYRDAPPA